MNSKTIASLFGSWLVLVFLAAGASAQVQRTFVSSTGSDSNPCSRLAPCRTFAQAISQTNAGGEVIVLDSAGYGPLSVANGTQITKAISLISPPGVYAGISVFSGNGIDINAGGSDTVILRGLTVNNQGSTRDGVVFNSGLKLHVEGCVINGFSSDVGLRLVADGAQVEVIDSTVRGNFFGIRVLPSSGTLQATIDHVRLEANGSGLIANEGATVTITNSVAANNEFAFEAFSSASGSVQMNVASSVVSGSFDGISAQANGTGGVEVDVAGCVISSNSRFGIVAISNSTGVATVRLSGSTVTGNRGTGLNNTGSPALILSRGDNTVEGNTTNTSGTIGTYSAK